MLIHNAKLLLGLSDNSQDSLLSLYSEIVEEELHAYCPEATYPMNLRTQMIAYKYQRKGTECLSQASYSDSSETFLTTYPQHILDQLEALKRKSKKLRAV